MTRARKLALNKVFSILALSFSLISVTGVISFHDLTVTGKGSSGNITNKIPTLFFMEEKQKIVSFARDACSFTDFILFGIDALVNNLKLIRHL